MNASTWMRRCISSSWHSWLCLLPLPCKVGDKINIYLPIITLNRIVQLVFFLSLSRAWPRGPRIKPRKLSWRSGSFRMIRIIIVMRIPQGSQSEEPQSCPQACGPCSSCRQEARSKGPGPEHGRKSSLTPSWQPHPQFGDGVVPLGLQLVSGSLNPAEYLSCTSTIYFQDHIYSLVQVPVWSTPGIQPLASRVVDGFWRRWSIPEVQASNEIIFLFKANLGSRGMPQWFCPILTVISLISSWRTVGHIGIICNI